MKMVNRERVEGTNITIGRRVLHRKAGEMKSRVYSAEYRDETGKQIAESLGTRSRLEARRKGIEIFNRLQQGRPHVVERKLKPDQLIDEYFAAAKAKGLAPKSEWKYRADLDKLKEFCGESKIKLAHRFGRESLFAFREWLSAKNYADKTVYGALTLAKQVFKWGHAEGKLREYRLAGAKIAKAKAKPQPCFTTEQVDLIIANIDGIDKAAFAILGFAGLRIGELEQLQWTDVQFESGDLGMFHIRRGGSGGTTKDKDARFVPIHPSVRPLLEALPRTGELVFPGITERQLLKRLKELCRDIGLANPDQYKLHSFRHHFASLCANHHVAYRKALAWLGHSSSEILDLYYHLHDADSQAAMQALAMDTRPELTNKVAAVAENAEGESEGALRATGESRIEKRSQEELEQELVSVLDKITERVGFEPTVQGNPYTGFRNQLLQPLGHLSERLSPKTVA